MNLFFRRDTILGCRIMTNGMLSSEKCHEEGFQLDSRNQPLHSLFLRGSWHIETIIDKKQHQEHVY
jgi:hypothetical protein